MYSYNTATQCITWPKLHVPCLPVTWVPPLPSKTSRTGFEQPPNSPRASERPARGRPASPFNTMTPFVTIGNCWFETQRGVCPAETRLPTSVTGCGLGRRTPLHHLSPVPLSHSITYSITAWTVLLWETCYLAVYQPMLQHDNLDVMLTRHPKFGGCYLNTTCDSQTVPICKYYRTIFVIQYLQFDIVLTTVSFLHKTL